MRRTVLHVRRPNLFSSPDNGGGETLMGTRDAFKGWLAEEVREAREHACIEPAGRASVGLLSKAWRSADGR